MNIHLSNLWNKLKTSLWFVPSIMAITTLLLAFVTLKLDRSLEVSDIPFYSIWQGGVEGARGLLSTIAGSIITMTGVVFSITIVALALTSNQYGSKLLPSFMGDFGTQAVLGTFISTSIYALLILRTVRGDSSNYDTTSFVPNISITLSVGLAILSLSMLVYFIHHLSVRIQSIDMITRVADDLIERVEALPENQYRAQNSSSSPPEKECHEPIFAPKRGYLQAIDYKGLSDLTKKHHFVIEIGIRPGHFLTKNKLLAKTNIPLRELQN